jgi:hypothetical protein
MNFFFNFRGIQRIFLLHYLLPDNTTDIWQKQMLYRVHHAWAGFQLTTLLVIGTDGIDSYKSNYHTITTAACKILTIKDLQQTSLWSWRLSIAISPFQEAFLLAVIKSYKEKKKKKSVSQDVILCTTSTSVSCWWLYNESTVPTNLKKSSYI